MRTTAGMLLVGLLALVGSGCTTTRSGLAKSDSPKPPAKSDVEVREKYGFPWGDSSKMGVAKAEGMPADLQAKLAENRSQNTRKESAGDLLQRARDAEQAGDSPAELQAAKLAYQRVLEVDPRNAEAHHRLGVIADKRQDFRVADQHYAQALASNRKDADLLMDVGYSHFLRGNLAESELFLKEALEVNPYNQLACEHLGRLYAQQGKYDAALAMFRQSATESEAQRMIAQAFPNGRPGANGTFGLPAANDRRVAPASGTDFAPTGQNFDANAQRPPQDRFASQRTWDQRFDSDPRAQASPVADAQRQSPWNNAQPFANSSTPAPPGGQSATLSQLAGSLYPSITPGNTAAPLAPPNNMATTATTAQNSIAPPLGSSSTFTVPPSWGTGPETNSASVATATAGAPNAGSAPPNGSTFWPAAPQANPATTRYDAARVPMTPANSSPFPPTSPAWDNPASSPPGMQPNGYENRISQPAWPTNATPSGAANIDAARWAAQMAMGSGPGAMFPAVSTPSSGSSILQTGANSGQGNEVRWAYGEMPGNGPTYNRVDNAAWSSDRAGPGNDVRPAGAVAPSSPWNNWQSPAPPSTNWLTPTDSPPPAANVQPYPSGAATTNPNAGYNAPPQWPAASGVGQPEMNSTLPAPTTISNWPYAPSR